MRLTTYIIALTICLSGVVQANEDPTRRLNKLGNGEFSWFGISLYTADLWRGVTQNEQGAEEATVLLNLNYNKNIPSKRIISVTRKEWSRLNTGSEEQQRTWLNTLEKILPDVSEGDQLSSLVTASGRTRFMYQGEVIGEVSDPEFGKAFLSIWLHPETRASNLRKQLLGDTVSQADLFSTVSETQL